MILKIGIDAITGVLHDLCVNDDFGVKIRANGNRNPVVLQKGEDDSTPMCAKEFLDQVDHCKESRKDITIVVQEDMESDKQKAWIWKYDEYCDYVESVTCSTDELNKTALLSFI